MALFSNSIPNLLNGVSQQAEILRDASQGSLQENCYPSLVKGLVKRPPLEWLDKIQEGGTSPDAFYHLIDRSPTERYLLVVRATGILQVFDLLNRQFETVTTPNGTNYLHNSSTNIAAIRAVTVADHTFIVNRDVTVRKGDGLAASSQHGGILVVRQGNYSTTYTVEDEEDGVLASVTTSPDDPDEIKTNEIASELDSQIGANPGWSSDVVGNVLWVRKSGGGDFTIRVSDSIGGDGLQWVKDRVSNFSELPPVGREGILVEITGDPSTGFDNFYVKAFPSGGFAQGPMIWREVGAPGVKNSLDPSTMPHVLVREADGTFTFRQQEWDVRGAGDDATNPFPTFVDNTIEDVFFFKNRLGFLSGENLIASQIGSFYNFFRETVTTTLDSDPVDVSVTTNEVAFLNYAAPYEERLLVFSDKVQFELKGDPLTPTSAHLAVLTKYSQRADVRPAVAGISVFFPFDHNQWTGVRELFSDREDHADAFEVTNHVPAFIPGSCRYITHAGNEQTLFLTTEQSPKELFLYKYHYETSDEGRRKVQSSWSVWDFPHSIGYVAAVDHNMYVVLRDESAGGRLYLTSLNLQPDVIEEGLDFNVFLDMKVSRSPGAPLTTFDGTHTTFSLPYRWDDEEQIVELVTLPYDAPETPLASSTGILASSTQFLASLLFGTEGAGGGDRVIQASADGVAQTVSFLGDFTDKDVIIGLRYNSRYQFTKPVVKEQSSGGGTVPITEGNLTLLFWTVNYGPSGWFSAKVDIGGQGSRQYIFNGPLATDPLPTGQLRSGRMKFPIRADARDSNLVIELFNDTPYPSEWINAGWEGYFTMRSQRF